MLALAATTALALQLPCGAPPRTRPLRMQLTEQEQKISEAMEIKPVSAESARSTGLALALDDGTRKSHSVAENTAFVTGFFRGIATKQAFGQLVASLYFVYDAMESAFTECDDEGVRALDYPQLRRRAALEEDMAYYFGPEWRDSVQPSPATRKYVARVEEVAREAPYLLIAHMDTRYLGDLFGGQMMGGMARRSLDLDASLGTKFYEFDDIPSKDIKPFIEEWYAQLNGARAQRRAEGADRRRGQRGFPAEHRGLQSSRETRRRRSSRSRSRRSGRRSGSSAARFRETFRSRCSI